MSPLKLVLDTNIVVSALLWGGVPYQFIRLATEGEIELFTSDALLAELHGVLARPHLIKRLTRHHVTVEQTMTLYSKLTHCVQPLNTPRVVPGDADDDHTVAAAVTAQADLIISGDRHLLVLGSHQNIPIATARQALERINSP